ncbi:MAG: hypothetical protein NTY47_08485, partial [Candidatus Omnitrophica bacterium]|nr:hypothetical protein [Candidatus Omnitrophota bacterium]
AAIATNALVCCDIVGGDRRYGDVIKHNGAANNLTGGIEIISKFGELLNIPQREESQVEYLIAVSQVLINMKDPMMLRMIAFRAFRELFNRPLAEGELLQEYKSKYAPGIHDLAQETPEGAEPVFAPLDLPVEDVAAEQLAEEPGQGIFGNLGYRAVKGIKALIAANKCRELKLGNL